MPVQVHPTLRVPTDEQRAAIDHRGGALRVLGAPRTGKTETAVAIVAVKLFRTISMPVNVDFSSESISYSDGHIFACCGEKCTVGTVCDSCGIAVVSPEGVDRFGVGR